MKISRRTHGIIDYGFGLALILSPHVFRFTSEFMAPLLCYIFGSVTIFYSAITKYEMSIFGMLPFSLHRFLDLVVAVALLGVTWHFQIGGVAGIVMTVFGAAAFIVVFLTERPPNLGTTAS